MAVAQLHPDPAGTVVGLVWAAHRSVSAAADLSMGSVGEELGDLVSTLAILESQVSALKLDALAEADARRLGDLEAATGTDAWAARLTGSTAAVMRGGIWLAQRLRETYHHTRVAFADGGINEAQARVIVRAGEQLPDGVTEAQRADCEAVLVAKAVNGMNAKRLRHAARRMAETISAELGDRQEADTLGEEEAHAARESFFEMHDNGDGTHSGKFTIPDLHAQILRAFLERLTAPRRWGRNKAGQSVDDVSTEGGMNVYEQRGSAFCELIEHLPTTGHGSNVADIVVHLDYEHLIDGLAAAGLDTGTRVSAGEARRLACNAGIIPAVLGGRSEILDWGRRKRLFTETQRKAVSVHYDCCAVEGCERPFAWCELHHKIPWYLGGYTDMDDAVPLCFFHHQRAHDDRYTMSFLDTGEVRYRYRRRRVAS